MLRAQRQETTAFLKRNAVFFSVQLTSVGSTDMMFHCNQVGVVPLVNKVTRVT